jgi:ribose transport system permease protein
MNLPSALRRHLLDYGMLAVLLLLCLLFSVLTWSEQVPTGEAAARVMGAELSPRFGAGQRALIAVRNQPDELAFAEVLRAKLVATGGTVEVVRGEPKDAREALKQIAASRSPKLAFIAASQATAAWLVFSDLGTDFPTLGSPKVLKPRSYSWPNFLKADNLLNIANQIAVIAILSIGMTLVVITAGIDLSVGSLIALSAVVCTICIRDFFGGTHAGVFGMILAGGAAMAVCALAGIFSGTMVTLFKIPPFIATLAVMLVTSGFAYILASGQSVYQVPDSFIWLGRGADLFSLPNAVVLMLVLYVAAHVLMSRMRLGRYLYAVGGNPEAARLSGVPIRAVTLFAYAMSGLLAGLGGVIMASQLKSGSPTYGQMYELYVIAAVVVGGTSLSGGEGKMFGTLIGALIIAVIQNGMNLTNVESYTQKVVLGAVILGAVLLDRLKHRWRRGS